MIKHVYIYNLKNTVYEFRYSTVYLAHIYIYKSNIS